MQHTSAFAVATLMIACQVAALPAQAAARTPTIDQRVESLLARMTLQEKIGQMSQFSEGNNVTGPGKTEGLEENIKAGNVGSVFNTIGIERNRKLQEIAVKQTRLGIPLLIGLDVIHGYRTMFPIPLAEACSWDLDAIELSAHIAAKEAASDGIHWTFAPMVDIARDPRWGRIAEGAGEDTYLGSQVAKARVRGFQGKDLKADDSVVACVKHFAGYGAALAGRDYNSVDLSRRTMLDVYLPPYRAAIEAGARTVMSAFNEYDGVPCTGNQYLLTEVLQKQWKFPGFVVSDWTSIGEMVKHGTVSDHKDGARESANAGLHMDMQSASYLNYLQALVKEGKVSQKQIDDATRRILRIKFEKGLFDDPYRAFDKARRDKSLLTPLNMAAARQVARKSIVLLKNENHLLPLKYEQKIALIGPLANDRHNMIGTWAAQGDGAQCRSPLDGISQRASKLYSTKGCEIDSQGGGGFASALEMAKQADVIVAVLGEASNMSGEAASRANPGLPGEQSELLSKLVATGKPVVLVVMNGRPLVLTKEVAQVGAVVEAWHLGTQAGLALADVLYGDYNPAGRLVNSFPRAVGQLPLFYNHVMTGRPYNKDDHYTSQYMDVSNDPLFPFGYGLSYTSFEYSPLKLNTRDLKPEGKLTVDVTVKNTGDRDGEEVAQLYVRDLVGSVNRPVKELKGFQKVMIKKGGSKNLRFTLTARDLAFHRRDMSFGAEAGNFKVWVGPHSAAGQEASFRLTRDVKLPY